MNRKHEGTFKKRNAVKAKNVESPFTGFRDHSDSPVMSRSMLPSWLLPDEEVGEDRLCCDDNCHINRR